jgi:hypothetical protein
MLKDGLCLLTMFLFTKEELNGMIMLNNQLCLNLMTLYLLHFLTLLFRFTFDCNNVYVCAMRVIKSAHVNFPLFFTYAVNVMNELNNE